MNQSEQNLLDVRHAIRILMMEDHKPNAWAVFKLYQNSQAFKDLDTEYETLVNQPDFSTHVPMQERVDKLLIILNFNPGTIACEICGKAKPK